MSILAVDVSYQEDVAQVAGVLIEKWEDTAIIQSHVFTMPCPAPYEPGAFYKRELPCILALLDRMKAPGVINPEKPDFIIIDGYVDLGKDHPGLGRHLVNALGHANVIGVAKTAFKDAPHKECLRGKSKNPLYITSAGVSVHLADVAIRLMHGPYRIPTILKEVDRLSRSPMEVARTDEGLV